MPTKSPKLPRFRRTIALPRLNLIHWSDPISMIARIRCPQLSQLRAGEVLPNHLLVQKKWHRRWREHVDAFRTQVESGKIALLDELGKPLAAISDIPDVRLTMGVYISREDAISYATVCRFNVSEDVEPLIQWEDIEGPRLRETSTILPQGGGDAATAPPRPQNLPAEQRKRATRDRVLAPRTWSVGAALDRCAVAVFDGNDSPTLCKTEDDAVHESLFRAYRELDFLRTVRPSEIKLDRLETALKLDFTEVRRQFPRHRLSPLLNALESCDVSCRLSAANSEKDLGRLIAHIQHEVHAAYGDQKDFTRRPRKNRTKICAAIDGALQACTELTVYRLKLGFRKPATWPISIPEDFAIESVFDMQKKWLESVSNRDGVALCTWVLEHGRQKGFHLQALLFCWTSGVDGLKLVDWAGRQWKEVSGDGCCWTDRRAEYPSHFPMQIRDRQTQGSGISDLRLAAYTTTRDQECLQLIAPMGKGICGSAANPNVGSTLSSS